MAADPLLRVRRAALSACLAAGGTPRLAQMVRAGLVVPASRLAAPERATNDAPPAPPTLLADYCRAIGRPVPARFRREREQTAARGRS